MIQDYTTEIQKLFLQMMLTDAELYTRVMNIMNPLNFNKTVRPIAEFIVEHTTKYSIMPDPIQIQASTGEAIELIPEITEKHQNWFLDEFEKFTKRQELERAIMKSAELLEQGDFDPVEKLIKDAVQISLQRDLGTDYFASPSERLDRYFNQGGQVSSGWPQLDRLMYGGFSRGELNVFAGGSGSGKSLVMMNIALNWLQQGLNGVYITLELSEELTSLRTDAMLTGMSTKDIRKHISDTELKVKMAGKKMGKYRVKALPAQSNINAIRSYIKEVQIQTGIKIDFAMIDYLDLLMPISVKVNPSDQFIKDKYVSEELRNFSKEMGLLLVTASQLNRSAVDEVEFDHSHIAGGISKINSSDYVFGIFTSRTNRERGKYQIQCMKARSSTGVGQKVELDYDVETMRISDSGEEPEHQASTTPTSLMEKIKTKSNIIASTPIDMDTDLSPSRSPVVDVQGAKLKSLLNNLKRP